MIGGKTAVDPAVAAATNANVAVAGATLAGANALASVIAGANGVGADGKAKGDPALGEDGAGLGASLGADSGTNFTSNISKAIAAATAAANGTAFAKFSGDVAQQVQSDLKSLLSNLLPELAKGTGKEADLKAGASGPVAGNDATSPQTAAQLQAQPLADRAPVGDTAAKQIHSPVGSHQWAQEMGSRITWMAKQGEQSALLRMTPEHLGPVEVQISLRDDQATLWFGAAHSDTRAALEQALPRLREMFAAQGMPLADAGVFRESPRQQSQNNGNGGSSSNPLVRIDEVSVVTSRSMGLLDAYA